MKSPTTVIANVTATGFIIGEPLTGSSVIVHNIPKSKNIFQHDILQVILTNSEKNIASFEGIKKRNYSTELTGRLHYLDDGSAILETFDQYQINNEIPVLLNNAVKNYDDSMYVIGHIKPTARRNEKSKEPNNAEAKDDAEVTNKETKQVDNDSLEYIFIPTQTIKMRSLPNRTYRFKRLHDNFPNENIKISGSIRSGVKDINYQVEYDHNNKKIVSIQLDCTLGVIIWNYGKYNPSTHRVVWDVDVTNITEVERSLRILNTAYYKNILHSNLPKPKLNQASKLIELYNMVHKNISDIKKAEIEAIHTGEKEQAKNTDASSETIKAETPEIETRETETTETVTSETQTSETSEITKETSEK